MGDATLLVVASVIGAGIFFTPGHVAELLPHPGWIAAAWLAGALISLAGALAFGELGAMYPAAGGDYVYLREGFHPVAGFLVGWLTFFAIYAGTIAALAAALAEGLAGPLDLGENGMVALAIAITVAVSAVNFVGVRWGALANNITSVIKVGALLAFGLLGPVLGEGAWSRLGEGAPPGETAFTFANFGLAMSPILFSYLGWNASVYVASEIRDPERNLPRSLILGLALCALVYLVMNAVYLYAIPLSQFMGVTNAGEAAAGALFGDLGGRLLGAFVLVSILGTLNAMILVGPRIAYAMALDGLFFGGADKVHAAFRTPGAAIVLQAVVSVVLLLILRRFPDALNFTVFAILLATIADVAVLYRLRWAQPHRPRPYRAWGYPWVPGLYLVANAGIALALVRGEPRNCAISVAVLLAGLPFYWLFRTRARSRFLQ